MSTLSEIVPESLIVAVPASAGICVSAYVTVAPAEALAVQVLLAFEPPAATYRTFCTLVRTALASTAPMEHPDWVGTGAAVPVWSVRAHRETPVPAAPTGTAFAAGPGRAHGLAPSPDGPTGTAFAPGLASDSPMFCVAPPLFASGASFGSPPT